MTQHAQDTQHLIGTILDEHVQRDAIHIAVVPAVAAERLLPAQYVELHADGMALPATRRHAVGVVDPFVEGVQRGERFFIFLLPNTITSLRHVWTHPTITAEPTSAANAAPLDLRAEAEQWLREFAEHIGLSYGRTLEAAMENDEHGDYHVFNYDTPDRVWSDREKFWRYYEVVTGKTVKPETREGVAFSCSC